jgi:Spy/CpxP family protein refolding chaperone
MRGDNMKFSKKILPALAAIAIIGFAGYAFSYSESGNRGWGMGYGSHMGGSGYHMGWNEPDRNTGLSNQQYEKIDQAREIFYKATKELRDNIYQKNLDLRRELANNNPDTGKAIELQKQLSNLKSEFDQKRLAHRLEFREIAPGYGRGYSSRGYGPGGGGYCGR